MIKYNLIIFFILVVFAFTSCSDSKQSERIFAHFLNRHVERIKPINKKINEAVWSTYSGQASFSDLLAETRITDSLYKKASEPTEYYQNLMNNVYDNSTDFELLMKIKKSGLLSDKLLKRQFFDVFRNFLVIQNDWNETDDRKAELYEQFFELKKTETTYWDSVNHIKSSDARKNWIEQFARLTDDFRSMVIAMNSDALHLGYDNYYQLIMDFKGVDYSSLDQISQIVEAETRADYKKLMQLSQIDICEKFNIESSQIKPQHYAYSINQMMAPEMWRKDYTQEECIRIIRDFFALGDYQIDEIIENSDLWFAEGKVNQSFFFCNDVDEKDHRIYANVSPTTMGVYILLHEFGHAIHFKYVDSKVPYVLKDPHEITTEGVAIYFNDKLYHSATLRKMMGIEEQDKSIYYKAFADPARLVFLRKLVRNIQFEKRVFENPNQDLNALWWNLTQEYMLYDVNDEDRIPEWMSNQHIINANGIHVFYLYAFAFSAQLEAHFPDNKIAPLKEGLMKYGDSMEWDQILKSVTGEELNLNYLFNSYNWRNKKESPISFDVKTPKVLSFLDNRFKEEWVDRGVYVLR